MSTPPEKPGIEDLDAFMIDESLEKADAIKLLRGLGVDTAAFFAKVDKTVQQGYSAQLRKIAEQEQSAQCIRPSFLSDLARMDRREMLSIFGRVSNGEFGEQYRVSALARCRNKDAADLTDEELRSWLDDIGDILGEP